MTTLVDAAANDSDLIVTFSTPTLQAALPPVIKATKEWKAVASDEADLAQNGCDAEGKTRWETKAEQKKKLEDLLAEFRLTHVRKNNGDSLSGGERRRTEIARALAVDPSFILLDEPFGALDQQTRLLMGDEVLSLWRKTGATIFLITHALDEAVMLSDRIGVMSSRPGRLIDIVETHWPRERDSTIVEDDRFGQITARLWRSLRSESMKAIGKAAEPS